MNEERRRYFRIDDSVGLSYQPIGPEEAKVLATEIHHGGGGVDYVSNFDNRIHTLLEAAKVQTPIVSELVDLMNRKINLLISQLELSTELVQRVAYTLQQVNISACGMAFHGDEPLDVNQLLRVELSLQPTGLQVTLLAYVVASEALTDGGYFVRLDFTEINSTDQELLIQHIVRRQSSSLKQRRIDAELRDAEP